MKHRMLVGLLISLSAGCAGPPPPPDPNATVIRSIGTPGFALLKIPTCIGSVVVAIPTAAVAGLVPTAEAHDLLHQLDYEVAYNCGPPWALEP